MENWPIYYKDNLWIGDPTCSVAIVTLWTPKEQIAQALDAKTFAICGQLYSKRGINFILRNIFANPFIQTIIVCGADRSESGKAILNFFNNGVDSEFNIIGSDKATIEKEIGIDAINLAREKIKCIDMTNSIDTTAIQKHLNTLPKLKAFTEPTLFPEPEVVKPDQYPSEGTTYTVRAKYIKDAWPQIIRKIMKFGGDYSMMHAGKVKELVNVITTITDEEIENPELNDDFDFNENDLKIYIDNFLMKDAGSEDYGYGERIFNFKFFSDKTLHKFRKKIGRFKETLGFKERNILKGIDQFDMVYRKLKSFEQDRGGLVTLWSTGKDNITSKFSQKVPCLTFLQFMVRDGKLHLNAYFRSNDMYKAWPRNSFALRQLQKLMSEKINKPIGHLNTISTLAQIYEEDWADAQNLIKKYEQKSFCIPESRSSLVIECMEGDIVVKHMSPDGNTLLGKFKVKGKQYKAAMRMTDILIANDIFSNYGHAMDIGRELMKAEMSIKEGYNFLQDRDYMEIAHGMSTEAVMKSFKVR